MRSIRAPEDRTKGLGAFWKMRSPGAGCEITSPDSGSSKLASRAKNIHPQAQSSFKGGPTAASQNAFHKRVGIAKIRDHDVRPYSHQTIAFPFVKASGAVVGFITCDCDG